MKANKKDTQFMLDELSDAISNDFSEETFKYNKWEQEFVGSIAEQWEYKGELSVKQIAKLRQIWEK